MGQFKLLMPWGENTVIGQVVQTLEAAGVTEIVVVTDDVGQTSSKSLSVTVR